MDISYQKEKRLWTSLPEFLVSVRSNQHKSVAPKLDTTQVTGNFFYELGIEVHAK